MVGHDSTILPGREGKVTQEINVGNLHSGSFRKFITVISNAKNTPEMRLSLGGTMRTNLESPNFLRLTPDSKGECKTEITLSTEKKDLKITEVAFKTHGRQT